MYQNKMAIAIKHNGKILREFKDLVYLPFGAQYSILLKNLNNRRVQVQVSIDGTDIGQGTTFIINANSELELKRFIHNGNLDEGNSFKFIERTSGIEDHRGVKMDDGIVRAEFQFERELIHNNTTYVNIWQAPYLQPYWYMHNRLSGTYYSDTTTYGSRTSPNMINTSSALRGIVSSAIATAANTSNSGESTGINTGYVAHVVPQSIPANDVGITVAGAKIEQQFTPVTNFNTEAESHVLILRLAGETKDNTPVENAVTVKSKSKCMICGKKIKVHHYFVVRVARQYL